jgi:putative heme-binding domain-containing protein
MVRSAVLRAIAERSEADAGTIDVLVSACKAELPGDQMGGPYERKFERFLARMALEQFNDQLGSYLTSEAASKQPSGNLLWASQALPEEQRNDAFLKIWASKSKGGKIDESTFVAIAGMLGSAEISKAVSPTLQSPENGAGYVAMALKNQAQVQSPQLATILAPVVEKMLGDTTTREQGLDAVARLKVPVASGAILKLLEGSPSPDLLRQILSALQASPQENRAVFASLTKNEALPFTLRLNALDSLTKAAPAEGQNVLAAWISKLSEAEKKQLVIKLSASKQGAGPLMRFHEAGQLATSDFDLASAERTHQANPKDPRGIKIFDELRKAEQVKKSEFASRLKHLMAVPERLIGDPAKGEVLFGSCVLCHKVGDQGYDIAPALDGSAHREREALLTAILDPDVAVEGGYLTFRVIKKDGSTLEGYRSKDDARGVTLAFMGGSTVFIPTGEIQSKQFVGGRSFMPKGLIDAYEDQQVADLLAFITTLK